MIKIPRNKQIAGEKGFVLILVLVILLFLSIIIPVTLNFLNSRIKAGMASTSNLGQLYAADAGVADTMWHIEYDHMNLFTSPAYDQYDYNQQWAYQLDEKVNTENVSIKIANVWVPKDIPPPTVATQAYYQGIINNQKLVVTGKTISTVSPYTYQITVSYDFDPGEHLKVTTVGVWLPTGFTYVPGQSNITSLPGYSENIATYAGNQAITWSFSPACPFETFPDANPPDRIGHITFQYIPDDPVNKPAPEAISWIVFDWTGGNDPDIPFSWDADNHVYQITSTAGNTTVEAYSVKNELRNLASAVSGDYFATGNSLLGGNLFPPDNYHYQLYNSTQAPITTNNDSSIGIPESATIEAAYLYWTGWMDWHDYDPQTDDTGWLSPANTGADTGGDGNGFESNPSNAYANGGGNAANNNNGPGSDRQRYMDYYIDNDDIPVGSTITGIEVRLDWWLDSNSGTNSMSAELSWDAGTHWTSSKATTGEPTSETTSILGSPSDNWGRNWTITELNNNNFRVRVICNSTSSSRDFRLDWVPVRIYYSIGGSLKYPSNPTPENLATLVEDTARVNKVLFNSTPITADTYQVLYPTQFDGTNYEDTWFYTAMADVTGNMTQWETSGLIDTNGSGNYTFGHYYVGTVPGEDNYNVNAGDPSYSFNLVGSGLSTGYPLGTPSPSLPTDSRYTAAHCGWSLLIVYSSPDTRGHQLYLYDINSPNYNFFFGWHANADFDNDGNDGGTVSGFIVPDQIAGETLAGRITVFVGEGDAGAPDYINDYFRVNGVNLSNSRSPANNVWNSDSPGLTVPGVDIDTFNITWASGILTPSITSVQLDIPTETDGFTMSYMILSFRSETTSGGIISYMIH